MTLTHHPATRYLTAALCALVVGLASVQGAEEKASAKDKASVKENARKTVTSAADLKKLFEEASKQRDAMIADYDTLKKQLADATEGEKQAIREKMEERKKAFEEMTNSLHKQIRDEQRKQRAGAAKR